MKVSIAFYSLLTMVVFAACSKSDSPGQVTPTPTITVPVMGGTTTVSMITTTNARSGGTINASGGAAVTAKGVCWSTSTNPTIANSFTVDGSGTGPGPTSFPSIITGLNPATTYYVRAYATNSVGTGYGNEISFITASTATLPVLATLEINAITGSSAVSGAVISSDGGSAVTARGVCWSTSPNPTTANFKTSDGTGTGSFTSTLTGLAEKTQYYVRSYATNTIGTNYGNEFSFKTIEAGTVFIGCDTKFYALNALTGQKKWEYTGPSSFSYVEPCFGNGKIFTGGGLDGYFYCLDTLNGNMIWRYQVGIGVSSPPTYNNGTVYFGGVDDYLYALDAATGALKWRFLTGGNVSSSPVVQNNVVYFGSDDSKVYALNTSNGTLIWSTGIGGLINGCGAALANGILYIGARNGFLFAINAGNGSILWNYDMNGISLELSSPTVVNNILYIGGYRNVGLGGLPKGSLYAINATTGSIVWEAFQNTGFNSSPVIDDGKLFITTEGGDLLAVNALDGNQVWRRTIYSNGSSPVVMNGIVYIGGGGTNKIYAIDVASSADRWQFPITNSSSTSGTSVVTASSAKHTGDSGMQQ